MNTMATTGDGATEGSAPSGCDGIEKVDLFGISISNIDLQELEDAIDNLIARGVPSFVVTPNVDHLCLLANSQAFRDAYQNASLTVVDGMPIVWAARLFGCPLKEKLSGSDLVPALSKFAARQGHSVYLLGAAEGVAEEAARHLQAQNPGIRVVGCYSPPFGFYNDPNEKEDIMQRLHEAAPHICFVALGSPKQEIFINEIYKQAPGTVFIGIGAGLDFIAGRVRRAPLWLRNAGFEWLWRLLMEPRRLWRRYLYDSGLFLRLVWREFRGRRLRPTDPH